MLRDERLYEEFERQAAERGEGPVRPDIAGNSREVQELHKMHVTLTHLLRVSARNFSIKLPVGPLYPAELLAVARARAELLDLDDDIEASMNSGGSQHDSVGGELNS